MKGSLIKRPLPGVAVNEFMNLQYVSHRFTNQTMTDIRPDPKFPTSKLSLLDCPNLPLSLPGTQWSKILFSGG